MSSMRWKTPTRSMLLGIGFLVVTFFWFTHHYEPPLASSARGGMWEIQNGDDSTGMKPPKPYPFHSRSVGRGMVDKQLPCKQLPGYKDVHVVLKTGSTELVDKLPVHLSTTLRCYATYSIYSDFEETYMSETVEDVLKEVNSELKEKHPDFELYRRLNEKGFAMFRGADTPKGRDALNASELSGPMSRPQGATGKPRNPGWRLDKWKFLPMMKTTLEKHPDKSWYVFVETDTYVMWHTLLNYLAALDATERYYIGGQIWIGDVVFAHGGTGFAVSKPALEAVVHNYQTFTKEWEDFTAGHWAGDCVLGKAFKNAGAPLTYAWPIWQGDDVGNMNYDRIDNGKRLWCHPTVSYHHLSPSVVEDLFIFEQEWILKQRGNTKAVLTHRDVFREYVLPRTTRPKMNWDNHADQDQGPAQGLADCLRLCFEDKSCVQYSLTTDMRCMTTSRPNLGEQSRGVDSGWVQERLEKFYHAQPDCGGESWITGNSGSG